MILATFFEMSHLCSVAISHPSPKIRRGAGGEVRHSGEGSGVAGCVHLIFKKNNEMDQQGPKIFVTIQENFNLFVERIEVKTYR